MKNHNGDELLNIMLSIPDGYSEVVYKGKRYSITRTNFNQGKSLKVYAEQLGGIDFISFNYYLTSKKNLLKPCEMPNGKVIDFLNGMAGISKV